MRVYKLIFSKNSYELNSDYESLTEHEKEIIANILPSGYFEFNDYNEHYNLYLIINLPNIKRYCNILNNNNIKYTMNDISEDLLNGYDIHKNLSPYINNINQIRFKSFNNKINKWITSNLEIDIILDRINQVGIENLTTIEKKYLENYKV